jgi:hypothetical protein
MIRNGVYFGDDKMGKIPTAWLQQELNEGTLSIAPLPPTAEESGYCV